MNQEKIGVFIAKLRKEKNMTQQELANKLGVTDRAISNWENGRRLPDYSLFKDLCDILSISINELFAGEKILSENYKKKADENMTNIVNKLEHDKKVFEKRMITLLIATTFLTMLILLLLPLKNFKDIIIFIMVIILAVISNTINVIAMVLKNK